MEYKQYSATDLAVEETFIDWVQRPNGTHSAFWEAYLAHNPQQAGVINQARQLVSGWQIDAPMPPVDSMNRVWAGIMTERDRHRYPPRMTSPPPATGTDRTRFTRYAAVFVGLLILSVAYRWFTNPGSPDHYATGRQETKTIRLPDGSTVILAANSSVTIVGDWKPEHTRELALRGEAFFSVKHQQNHQKFVVKMPANLRVEVLGTVFTIAERASKTQVVLNTGKVALYVNKETQPLLMKPGELVDVPRSQQQPITRRTVKPDVYSAWTAHQFVFEDTSLGEIAAMIENEFGYPLVFTDNALKDRRVTLRLPGRDLNVLLTALAEIHDLTIDRQARRIVVTPMADLN